MIKAWIAAGFFGLAIVGGESWIGRHTNTAFGWFVYSIAAFGFGLYQLKLFWKAP